MSRTVVIAVWEGGVKVSERTVVEPTMPEADNELQIRTTAAAALTTNRTYLAVASPTNAQVVAQVRALTRQTSGVIRMLLTQFDSTD